MAQTPAEKDACATSSKFSPIASDDLDDGSDHNGAMPVNEETAKAFERGFVVNKQTQAVPIGHNNPHNTQNQCLMHNAADKKTISVAPSAQMPPHMHQDSTLSKQWA